LSKNDSRGGRIAKACAVPDNLRRRLDAVIAIVADEAFDPCMIIAEEDQFLRAVNDYPIHVSAFGMLEAALRCLEFQTRVYSRSCQVC
jgi:hypothetical protein